MRRILRATGEKNAARFNFTISYEKSKKIKNWAFSALMRY